MRLLSKRQVLGMVPVSHTTLRRWESQGLFPRRIHYGGDGAWQKAFWKEDEVLGWLQERYAQEPADAPN